MKENKIWAVSGRTKLCFNGKIIKQIPDKTVIKTMRLLNVDSCRKVLQRKKTHIKNTTTTDYKNRWQRYKRYGFFKRKAKRRHLFKRCRIACSKSINSIEYTPTNNKGDVFACLQAFFIYTATLHQTVWQGLFTRPYRFVVYLGMLHNVFRCIKADNKQVGKSEKKKRWKGAFLAETPTCSLRCAMAFVIVSTARF